MIVILFVNTVIIEGTHGTAGTGAQGLGSNPGGRSSSQAVEDGNPSPAVGVDDILQNLRVFRTWGNDFRIS